MLLYAWIARMVIVMHVAASSSSSYVVSSSLVFHGIGRTWMMVLILRGVVPSVLIVI